MLSDEHMTREPPSANRCAFVIQYHIALYIAKKRADLTNI
jgi:hypothetical protein